jgi:hypothetical protein
MGQPALDPQEFLRQLKAENQVLHWEPLPPVARNHTVFREQTRAKDSLDYLHQHWVLPNSFQAGGGARGKLGGVLGKLVFRVLDRYLTEERELFAHVVRTCDALDRRCDELTQQCDELTERAIDRQVDEAANQARLAAWLHAEAPRGVPVDIDAGTAGVPRPGETRAGGGEHTRR